MNIKIDDLDNDSLILAMEQCLNKLTLNPIRRRILENIKSQAEENKINKQASLLFGPVNLLPFLKAA